MGAACRIIIGLHRYFFCSRWQVRSSVRSSANRRSSMPRWQARRMFAKPMIFLGFAVSAVGLFTDGPPEEPFAFSGPLGGGLLVAVLIPITYYSNRIGHLVAGVSPDIIVAAVGAVVVLGPNAKP